jgi:hypothetical protein
MKSRQKRMPAKKPKQQKQPSMDNMSTTTGDSGGVSDDVIIITGSPSDTTIDLGGYGAAQSTYNTSSIDTITLDPSSYITTGTTLNWSTNYGDYNVYTTDPRVQITGDGITMKSEADLKIGDRSLKDFMDRVEDRLAILHPNEALEDKWEELKNLRRQYEALEKDILEKERIMKILKEQ